MPNKKTDPDPNPNTELESLKSQFKQIEDSWKRALADYQNLQRRVEEDKKNFTKVANVNLISRLIPSLDIIDMAATHTKDLGVEMAAKQFRQALTEEGLVEINPSVNDKFDHNLHECIEIIESKSDNDLDNLAEIVLKGYKIGDYILRPAKVKVFNKIIK